MFIAFYIWIVVATEENGFVDEIRIPGPGKAAERIVEAMVLQRE